MLTIVTYDRRAIFVSPAARRMFAAAIRRTLALRPMDIHAMVLLPQHVHMLCGIPDEQQDYSTRIRLIKRRFTQDYLSAGGSEGETSDSRRKRGIRGVWQKRFHEHTIRNQREFRQHVDYIHMNPVKHRLVARPTDWPWSSIHRYIRQGLLPTDWTGPTDLPGVGDCDSEVW